MVESIPVRKRFGRLALVVSMVASALILPAAPVEAAEIGAYEVCLLDAVNASRRSAGAAPLTMASDLVRPVRAHSEWMRYNGFQHMSSPARIQVLPNGWSAWAENIAMRGNENDPCSLIHDMFMNSPGHRANILNPAFKFVALGAYSDNSGIWVTQLFFTASGYTPGLNGRFWDDDTSIFEGAIESLAARGITGGCNPPTNDRFCPDDRVTRGMMAAFLVRALNINNNGGGIDFTDDNGSIFEGAIEKLAAAGITQGCNPPTNTKFCPDQFVTRGMMAAFLVRGLNLTNSGGGIDFTDDNGSIFEDSIEKLAAAGITQGCNPPTNTRFCPDDHVTRGMMAAFLIRGLDR